MKEQMRERDRQLIEMTNVQLQLQQRDEQVANLKHLIASLEEQLRTKEQGVSELEISLSTVQKALVEVQLKQTADWVISCKQIQLTETCLGRGGWGIAVEG